MKPNPFRMNAVEVERIDGSLDGLHWNDNAFLFYEKRLHKSALRKMKDRYYSARLEF